MPRSKNADSSSANGHVELQPLNVDDNDYSKHEEEANNDKKVEEKKPPEKKSVSLLTLYRYATGWDRFALILGCIVAAASGAGWPLMSTIFGGLSNTFLSAQSSFGGDAWNNDSSTSGATMSTITSLNSSASASSGALDQISKELFLSQTIQYCLQYTYLGCGVLVAGYLQIAIWITVSERMMNKIRAKFFEAILRQDIAWFDEKQSGTLVTHLSDAMERIKEGVGDKFGLLIQYVAQFFAGFIIAFIYSWKLTLVMLSLTPLMALSGGFMGKMISSASRREQELYSVAGAIAEEVLSCIRTVIAFNGQKRESDRYENALQTGKVEGVKKSIYTGLGMGVVFLIMFSSYGLAFWYGSTLIASGEIPRGTVFTVLFSVMMGSFALGNAGPSIALIATAKGSAHAIFEIIDRVPAIDAYNRAGKKLAAPRGKIEISNVSFRYPTRPDMTVLNGVSIAAEPGETIALVGSSGCGKSTLVNLLLRYYDVTSGSIKIDGEPIKSLNLKWMRNLIAVVSQEPILFDATVEENIRFGRQNVTHAEMMKVCKMANAHDFISKLPQGYKTEVGERGTQLSGGQKQRIAIARALVRDPKILLLDEATSALDSESESIVQEALEKAAKGRTTIVIAHRLSTIRNADKIVVLAHGEVKEVGTHAELIEKKQLYFDLVNAQLFQDTGASADPAVDKEEHNEEGAETIVDSPTKPQFRSNSRQYSRVYSRQMSGMSDKSDLLSNHSDSQKPRRRLLDRKENERERLKREMEAEGAKQSNFWQIFSHARNEWCYIFCGLMFGVVRGLIMPAFALFYSELFNTYSKTGEELLSGARFWSLMFLGLGVLEAVTWFFSAWLFGVAGENVTMKMRLSVFKNVLRQDVAFFDDPRHSTGKICTRLATDAPNVKAALDFRLANVLSAVISMAAGVILAFFFGWKMALLVLAIFPLVGFGGYIRLRLREGGAKSDSQLLEEAGKTASQAIENVRTVQALTREKAFYETFVSLLQHPYRESIKQAHIQAISYGFSQAIFFFMYAASFRFGAYLVGIDDMAPLDVYRVFFAVNFSGMAVGWATAYFPEYMKARFSAGLIFKMLGIEPKIDSNSAAGLRTDLTGELTFNDVYFNYPSRVEAGVLKGVSFRLEPGQTMALVGKSGCGKSTVVSLIERFYDTLDGKILTDGVDVRTMNVGHLRASIALVSQEPVLFDCSIKDNISYGLENVSFEAIVDAAKRANIHDFIDTLPEAYSTRVGEKGTQLSGGQKQRVAIARALIRSPRILLLDEATSALDTESEKIVQEALDKARLGRTCIIIAHRLSTVQNADIIGVMHMGRIVEHGSHAELVAQKGIYYDLIKKQNLAS